MSAKQKMVTMSLREADVARLDTLSAVFGVNRTECVRQLLPSDTASRVFEKLKATNPGLSFAFFIDTCIREWLVAQAPKLTVEDMLEGLRSKVLEDRIQSGKLLAMSIGHGLRQSGEHAEDVQNILVPQLSRLLDQAIAGDKEALSRLECELGKRKEIA